MADGEMTLPLLGLGKILEWRNKMGGSALLSAAAPHKRSLLPHSSFLILQSKKRLGKVADAETFIGPLLSLILIVKVHYHFVE